ncbi:zinc finger protein 227-like isoform X2 [Eurosta solidaginis]|uniref:zinc finger protein 227-like isoform X2 n=1 Tax=Eurosta solidaginis TaxID=178769 RepID=UPI003530F109
MMAHNSELKRGDSRKCGEISALLSRDKQEFYLDCGFCEFTYLQLNNFIQHIYDDHQSEFPHCLIKQESRDFYDLDNAVEEHLEDDIYQPESSEDSEDADAFNNFETIILEKDDDGDIKNEFSKGAVGKAALNINKREIISNSEKKRHRTLQEFANDVDDAKEVIEAASNIRSKPITKEIKITDTIIDVSECIILAGIHKKYTCLWDENDIAYRFNNRRDEALECAREEFNKATGLHLNDYEFERELLRLRKICTYEKKQKIICTQNKTEYKASCIYYDHIQYLEVDVAPFVCSICGQQYPALGKLKVHEATHDGSKPFKCNICGRGFQCGNYFTVHLRRHAQDLRYPCEVCNKIWATTTERMVHMRTHTGEKPYVCSICGSKWTTSSQLIDHTQRHNKERRFKCEICSKGFTSPSMLREHVKTHTKVRAFICDTCKKGFKCRKHLTQHKRIHDIEKRYVCKICEKRFAQSAGLSGHMKSHGTIPTTYPADTDLN